MTPELEAAVRAGCNADGDGCTYPNCGKDCVPAKMITATLRALCPREPGYAELIRIGRTICCPSGCIARSNNDCGVPGFFNALETGTTAAVYRNMPLWRGLWGENDETRRSVLTGIDNESDR